MVCITTISETEQMKGLTQVFHYFLSLHQPPFLFNVFSITSLWTVSSVATDSDTFSAGISSDDNSAAKGPDASSAVTGSDNSSLATGLMFLQQQRVLMLLKQ